MSGRWLKRSIRIHKSVQRTARGVGLQFLQKRLKWRHEHNISRPQVVLEPAALLLIYFTLLPKNKGQNPSSRSKDATCRLLAHPSISHARCRLAVPALTSSPFVPHRFSMVASDWEPPSRFWPARPGETWPPTQLQDDWSPVAAHAASRQLHSKCGVWLSGFSWQVGAWDR